MALIEFATCQKGSAALSLGDATLAAYLLNRDGLESEAEAEAIGPYLNALAALMLIGTEMEDALFDILGLAGIGLETEYFQVSCDDGECLPAATDTFDEPYSGEGDFDSDGAANAEEFENVIDSDGDIQDFLDAAVDPDSDGTVPGTCGQSAGVGGGANRAVGLPWVLATGLVLIVLRRKRADTAPRRGPYGDS